MSQDPYRPPEAPLIRPGSPLEPRSPVVAVLLGWLTPLLLTVPLSVAAQRLEVPLDSLLWVLPASGLTGLLAGWIAARYRRGPWLGVSLALVGLDLAVAIPVLTLGIQSESAALQIVLSAAGDLLGGYAGRGARARAATG